MEEKPMRVQRVFALVGSTRKETNRYIIIMLSNVKEKQAAEQFVSAICNKMTEMDKEFKNTYKPLRKPEIDEEEETYTDLISYEKAEGKMSIQRQYVGKLMTRAMAALK